MRIESYENTNTPPTAHTRQHNIGGTGSFGRPPEEAVTRGDLRSTLGGGGGAARCGAAAPADAAAGDCPKRGGIKTQAMCPR